MQVRERVARLPAHRLQDHLSRVLATLANGFVGVIGMDFLRYQTASQSSQRNRARSCPLDRRCVVADTGENPGVTKRLVCDGCDTIECRMMRLMCRERDRLLAEYHTALEAYVQCSQSIRPAQ